MDKNKIILHINKKKINTIILMVGVMTRMTAADSWITIRTVIHRKTFLYDSFHYCHGINA
jgi:hypothetical protein